MAFVLLAVLVGLFLPVQAGVNAQLRLALGHPLTTALISFLVGTVALAILAVMARVPPAWLWPSFSALRSDTRPLAAAAGAYLTGWLARSPDA